MSTQKKKLTAKDKKFLEEKGMILTLLGRVKYSHGATIKEMMLHDAENEERADKRVMSILNNGFTLNTDYANS